MDTVPTQEGTFKTPDGQELYTKTWTPPSTTKARLVFIHGFSDHCNFYETLFNPLAEKGIKVYAFDQRGWGRSVRQPAQKGLTGPTALVESDITAFINSLPTTGSDASTPLFLAGHSMGGAEILTYAAVGPQDVTRRIRGYLAESPYIALHPSSAPYRIIEVLGRLAAKVAPRMQMVQKLDAKKVSRDVATVKRCDDDALCHDTGTFEGLAGMLDRAAQLGSGRVVVREGAGEGGRTRVWVGHGTEDLICGYAATKRLVEAMPVEDKELRTYDGWYHKLHTEPGNDRALFAEEFAKWILDRAGEVGEAASGRAKL